MTPTLTLNYGLRWDLQTPFRAANNSMTTVSLQSVCGMSGLGDGSTFNKCNFFNPAANTRRGAAVRAARQGQRTATRPTGTTSPRASASAWKPNVQGGFLRTILGDPDQATLRGGYSESFERQGLSAWTGIYGSNPGSDAEHQPDVGATATSCCPASRGRFSSASPNGCIPARSRARQRIPTTVRSGRQDSLNAFAPDIVDRFGAHLVAQLPARDWPRHGGRRPLRRHQGRQPVVGAQLQHPRHPSSTGSSTSSSSR